MSDTPFHRLKPSETPIEDVLNAVQSLLSSKGVEALAVGSRIRGHEHTDSDLDLLVIEESVASESFAELEEEMNSSIDTEFRISIDIKSLDKVCKKLEQGDPLILTLFAGFVPLTLTEKTLSQIQESYPEDPPESMPELIKRVQHRNASTAGVAVINAIIYEGYYQLAETGELPVPPQELPDAVAPFNKSLAAAIRVALDLRQQIRAGQISTEAVLESIIQIIGTYGSNSE
ncbi:nucleotidyltransferase family protein (plasmid) [Haloarcula sp. KBTZ06]|uniref:nucleotidyltransferase family protein n=1 Tax=Haloarcula TaxID=2237 RepID=UPI003B42B523